MNRNFFIIFSFLILFAGTVKAQVFSAGENSSSQFFKPTKSMQSPTPNSSAQFLQNLRNCKKYKESTIVDINGVSVPYTMEILGLGTGNICRVRSHMSIDENNYTNVNCAFNAENLIKYVNMQEKFAQLKNYEEDIKKIPQEELSEFFTMISDKSICSMHVSYDETKQLRENLTKCTPYQFTFDRNSSKIFFNIVGKNNALCSVQYIIETDLPPIKSFEKGITNVKIPTQVYYNCLFSGYNIEELKLIFEQERINSSDFGEIISDNRKKTTDLMNRFLRDGICKVTDIKQ